MNILNGQQKTVNIFQAKKIKVSSMVHELKKAVNLE